MTVKEKKDEEANVNSIVPDEKLLLEAEQEDLDYSRVAHEADVLAQSPVPFTWHQCTLGYKSWYCRNAAFSALTCNGVLSFLTLNGLFCLVCINGFASILSLNSVFSIASMNCVFCIGCEGEVFCLGKGT